MDHATLQSAEPLTGRRATPRLRVRLPATLLFRAGQYSVVLENLSEDGARVSYGPGRPANIPIGTEVMLRWHRFEFLAGIRWTTFTGCGLMFDTPIGYREIMLTRSLDEKSRLPAMPGRDPAQTLASTAA